MGRSDAGLHSRRRACQGSTRLKVLLGMMAVSLLSVPTVPRVIVDAAGLASDMCAKNVADINTEVERWAFVNGCWPKDGLSDIAADPAYRVGEALLCPVTGKAYELDPITHRVKPHAH